MAAALCFVEELGRMLSIVMSRRRQRKAMRSMDAFRVDHWLRDKHVLMVHCDVMLMEFVRFMARYPVPSVLRRVLMPAIFAVLDHLMVDNMKRTGKCMDQLLLAAEPAVKQTLSDIHSEYEQQRKLQREQRESVNVETANPVQTDKGKEEVGASWFDRADIDAADRVDGDDQSDAVMEDSANI